MLLYVTSFLAKCHHPPRATKSVRSIKQCWLTMRAFVTTSVTTTVAFYIIYFDPCISTEASLVCILIHNTLVMYIWPTDDRRTDGRIYVSPISGNQHYNHKYCHPILAHTELCRIASYRIALQPVSVGSALSIVNMVHVYVCNKTQTMESVRLSVLAEITI